MNTEQIILKISIGCIVLGSFVPNLALEYPKISKVLCVILGTMAVIFSVATFVALFNNNHAYSLLMITTITFSNYAYTAIAIKKINIAKSSGENVK